MNEFYTRDTNIELIKHKCVETFIEDFLDSQGSFNIDQETFAMTKSMEIKTFNWSEKTRKKPKNQFCLLKNNLFSRQKL